MSETAFRRFLLRIQLEVFLSSCDLTSVSLFLNWKQYKIFVNLSSRSLPWYLYFLFLIVRDPRDHTSELQSGTWRRGSLLLLIWSRKLKALYLSSPGKILLVNASCPLFTLVSLYQLSQIDYLSLGWEEREATGPSHAPGSDLPVFRSHGSEILEVRWLCVFIFHLSGFWQKSADSWGRKGGGKSFKLIWV